MSTLSVHRLENVQDFDMANTPFTTAFNAANSAFAVTNAAFNTTNTAYNFANTVNTFAYGVAVNSAAAFAAANNVAPQVTPAFLTGNLAYALANNAYASINSNWTVTNALYSVANSAYGAANNVGPQIAPTYNTANAAFAAANTKFSSSGGTISGAVEITADLTVHGNTRFVDQQTLSVGDPLIYLAANNYASDVVDIGFVANYVNTGGANVHTGLYRSSGTKEYYLFYGYDKEPLNNYIDPTGNNITKAILNADIRTSNLILGGANTINWIGAAYGKANTALQNTTGTLSGTLTVDGMLLSTSAIYSNTGIGEAQLHVRNSTSDVYLFNSYAGNSFGFYDGTNAQHRMYYDRANNFWSFYTGATERMHLDSTGLGIGTNSPSFKLHVEGTSYFNGPSIIKSNGAIDPDSVGSGVGLGYISDQSGFSAPGITFGTGAGGMGALVYGANTMYFGAQTGAVNTLNTKMTLDFNAVLQVNGSVRTPIFYDSDNTAYYVDPAGTTNLGGDLNVGSGASYGLVKWGGDSYHGMMFRGYPTNNTTGYSAGDILSFWEYGGTFQFYARNTSALTKIAEINTDYLWHYSDIRTPIFYDNDNTAYYVDPNSTSVLSTLNVGQQIGGGGGDQIVQWRNTALSNTQSTVGSHANWANTPLPGVYYSNYNGHSGGIVVFPGTGSVGKWAIEATYYGDLWFHSNVDSIRWYDYRILTDNNITNVFTQSNSSSGYSKLPNGFIIQWGNFSIGDGGTQNVTFPIAFSSGCYAVNITQIYQNGADQYQNGVRCTGFPSTTGVSIRQNTNGTNSFFWVALGF